MKSIMNFLLYFLILFIIISLFAITAFACGAFVMWDINVFMALFKLPSIAYRVVLLLIFLVSLPLSINEKKLLKY